MSIAGPTLQIVIQASSSLSTMSWTLGVAYPSHQIRNEEDLMFGKAQIKIHPASHYFSVLSDRPGALCPAIMVLCLLRFSSYC